MKIGANCYILFVGLAPNVDLFGWFDPVYPPLSLDSDPLFILVGVAVGLFFVQTAGCALVITEDGSENYIRLSSE